MSSLEKKIRVLFIGNSHTYYNDMPGAGGAGWLCL